MFAELQDLIYFNILPPGSDGVAIYNGSLDLPGDGDYTGSI